MKSNKASHTISISGVILAGGLSTRMQQDKKFLKYQDKTFLDIATSNLHSANCDSIFLSLACPPEFPTNLNIITDELKDIGAIAGVYSVLNAKISADYLLLIPVDMPLLSPSILQNLSNNLYGNGANYKDYVFPFIIKNNLEVLNILQNLISNKCYSLKKFLTAIASQNIDITKEDKNYLQNINYYEQFLGLPNAK
ncbi:MAG: molybdenum cofactor guanylyltransferase [Alphaproteobacteria bacterium]|jgi:molybdopterin-guanine dinucleotide biosynthesis protein A|nr:molybdenum cofactor guanylyltransferase [Alphaproteobacteria bacterium]